MARTREGKSLWSEAVPVWKAGRVGKGTCKVRERKADVRIFGLRVQKD